MFMHVSDFVDVDELPLIKKQSSGREEEQSETKEHRCLHDVP
jgi:hypothetical protein